MQEEDMISLNEFKALVEIYQGFKFLKGETEQCDYRVGNERHKTTPFQFVL